MKAETQAKCGNKRCPYERDHATDEPEGYLAWHAWAEKMSRTHKVLRCGGCGLFKVWVAREVRR